MIITYKKCLVLLIVTPNVCLAMEQDYYKLVGLHANASQADIEARYQVFQKAFDVLRDPAKLFQYNLTNKLQDFQGFWYFQPGQIVNVQWEEAFQKIKPDSKNIIADNKIEKFQSSYPNLLLKSKDENKNVQFEVKVKSIVPNKLKIGSDYLTITPHNPKDNNIFAITPELSDQMLENQELVQKIAHTTCTSLNGSFVEGTASKSSSYPKRFVFTCNVK